VDASFSSFLRAEEKDRPFWFFSKRTQGDALMKKGVWGTPPARAMALCAPSWYSPTGQRPDKKRGLGNPQREMKSRCTSLSTSLSTSSKNHFPKVFFEEINDFLWKCERKAVILQPFLIRYTENEENTIVFSPFAQYGHTILSPGYERLSSAILHSARDENRRQPVTDRDAPDAARCHSPTAPARPQTND
jgi:hypothetical protein